MDSLGLGLGADALGPHADWTLSEFAWDADALVASPLGGSVGESQGAALRPRGHSAAARRAAPPPAAVAPLRCQVGSCHKRLEALRAYNQRSRLCDEHMRADQVALDDGTLTRFCQKCNRLQPLTDFDGNKHTCAAALATHNARRRYNRRRGSPTANSVADEPAPDDSGTATRRDAPTALAAVGLPAVSDWLGEHAAPATTVYAALLMMTASPGTPGDASAPHADLSAAAAAAAAAAALHGYSVHIKLPALATPAALPAAALREAADGAALFPTLAAAPTGAVRPGCVLLTLDALVRAPHAQPDAAAAAAVLRRAFVGQHAAAAAGATVRAGASEAPLDVDGGGAVAAHAPQPPPPRLQPSAVVVPTSSVDTELAFSLADVARDAAVVARLGGATLRCRADDGAVSSSAAGPTRLLLHARGGEEGAALLEVQLPARPGAALPLSHPRVVLLCADAAAVAQMCAACDAPGLAAADDARLQRVLRVVGDALRPGAPTAVRCAAVAAAVWLGWSAVLARLLLAPAPDAGPVLLCAAAHAAACARSRLATRAGNAACADAVAAAAVQQHWTLHGCQRVVQLLVDASDCCAHLRAECAAAAALAVATSSPEDAAASPVLRALLALLAAAPDDTEPDADTDEDDLPSDSLAAADEEASYVEHLARYNARHWLTIAVLSLLGSVMQLYYCVRYVLQQAGGVVRDVTGANAALLAETRLHPFVPLSAPPFSPRAVPWGVVVAHTRVYVVAAAALRVPAQLALVAASWRLTRHAASPRNGRFAHYYEPLFFTLLMIDTFFYFFIDLLVLHATGAAVEWPVVPAVVHAAGLLIGFRNVPFRRPLVLAFALAKALSSAGLVLMAAGRWRVLLRNPGYVTQIGTLLSAVLLARARDVAMRAANRAAAAAAAAHEKQGAKQRSRATRELGARTISGH